MAAPQIEMDGKLIQRQNIAWINPIEDETTVSLVTVDGTRHEKTYSTGAKAISAYAILKNLTDIDDIDGL